MLVPRLIERKRDGLALTPEEWRALIAAYVAGQVPDYQMSALAMAVVWRGLEPGELAALTEAMLRSGASLEFEGWATPRVDKHSIGGVGDKTSLLLAPMVACCGVAVPMISGRGLGHTGGTLDKLEAIPGFRTRLALAEAVSQVKRLGLVMLGQTPEICPADRKLYALRDVTGTVESIPLISASIMSKKLAEGLTGLVLDVKTGSGAFITEPAQSLVLAKTMLGIGEAHGCRTVALLTAMDRPLGHACGNALEVAEAIEGLKGRGPPDLMEVTYALAAEMLLVAGAAADRPAARARLEATIRSGRALEKFARLVEAQGGDPQVVEGAAPLARAAVTMEYRAVQHGVVAEIPPRKIGHAIIALGGGRARTEDAIDPAVGFVIPAKPGDRVRRGDVLAVIHARTEADAERAHTALDEAIVVGERANHPLPLVSHRVTAAGVESLT
ncbi:MAG TPA: thymidine phosphorylase [Gemmatimonadales bacterium]|jgi:pyrimidine-nucleoside phosphorylase|nr:thymidine phosphorylase [Gemmatimonadales bacterium]